MSKITLREGQAEGVDYLVRRKHPLLFDDVGFGKTIMTIEALNRLKAKKVLIICPASVKENWRLHIEEFFWQDSPDVGVIQGIKNPPKYPAITIINYDIVKDHYAKLKRLKWAVIVADEVHKLKSPFSKRTKCILATKNKFGLTHNAERFISLSGTPIINRPLDLYPILKSFFPGYIPKYLNYESFAVRYCGGYHDEWGDLKIGFPLEKQQQEMNAILSKIMFRRLRPKTGRNIELVPISQDNEHLTQILKQQREEVEEFMKFSKDETSVCLVLRSKFRQEIGIAKTPLCVDFIRDLLETNETVLVFAYHRAVILELECAMEDLNPLIIHGGVLTHKRQPLIDSLGKEGHRVLIGQIDAMGEGVNGLQHVCSTCVFAETNYNDFEQAIGRLDREGQTEMVNAYVLSVVGSLDYDLLKVIIKKQDTNRGILDRGTQV